MKREKADKRSQLALLLTSLECELKALDLWEASKPSEHLLNSELPFCIDTLSFPQWLQFVFIEKMKIILNMAMPLPQTISVAPMATEYFTLQQLPSSPLIILLEQIDTLITENKIC
ncbi:hypothetical protein PCNPT3_09525 [Psychromonas sp. CNPT3]|uniref:YqcC family protein n=1 Tax=Psychromonas sp. CNPT3 TaxID=314282 RepID=UPI00006E914D|nr:YqcC family protein [Psychromonas sp. CNPT3]AGH81843.1 hypothetical protein PCNPT3_09525 [Psychromonas sp. CNPT3]